ncbi:hypothetical protein NKH77_28770 [Streptomyces sp. M19]
MSERFLPFLSVVPEVDEVWGFGWSLFNHAAAGPVIVAMGQGDVVKNAVPVASRHAFEAVRRALRPGSRTFLDTYYARLGQLAEGA